MVDESCPVRIISKGVRWQNIVSLAYPAKKGAAIKPPFEVELGVYSSGRYDGQSRPVGRDKLVATYVGFFETFSNLEDRIDTRGTVLARMGFGHLWAAPAQLTIKRIKDGQVLPL